MERWAMKWIGLAAALAAVFSLPGQLWAVAAVWEPFDYDPGSLTGLGGTTEVGLTGVWDTTASQIQAVAPGLSWNELVVAGNSQQRNADNFGFSDRAIAPGALAGMLDEGDTLWFSTIARMGWTGQCRDYFSIGSDGHQHSAYNHWGGLGHVPQGTISPEHGMGFGIETGGQIFAVSNPPGDQLDSDGWDTEIHAADSYDVFDAQDETALIVGKILFGTGGGEDVLELYVPTDMDTLGPVRSTISADLAQGEWDTISFFQKSYGGFDEVRIGATQAEVMPRPGQEEPGDDIPEPATMALLGLAACGLGGYVRRRRKA